MKAVISIAARMGSSRLPGKTMADIGGMPMLEQILWRLWRLRDEIVIATTDHAEDRPIVSLADKLGVQCVRGSQTDLMARHAQVMRETDADVLLLAGADDPFLDPETFMSLQRAFEYPFGYQYLKSTGLPLGMNAWGWTRAAMEDGDRLAKEPDERQHVVPFWERRPDRYRSAFIPMHWPDLYDRFRLTVDNQEDLDLVRAICGILGPTPASEDVIDLLERYPSLALMNGIHLHGTAARDAIYDVTPVDERVTA